MQSQKNPPIYTKLIFILFGIILLSPLVFSNEAIYGTIVHRYLFFWFWVDVALVIATYDKIHREKKIIISPFHILLLLNLLVVFISNILGEAPYNSMFSSFERMTGYISLIHFIVFFLIGSSYKFTNKQWTILFMIFILVGFICGIMGLMEYKNEHDMRLTAGQSNPMHSSGFMLGLFFIALLTLNNANTVSKKKKLIITISLVGLLFFTYILFLTLTRAAVYALFIGIITFFFLSIWNIKRIRKYISIGLGLLVTFIVFTYIYKNEPIVNENRIFNKITDIDLKSGSIKARLDLWKIVTDNLTDRPFLGWGQENFIYFYAKHYTPNLYDAGSWYDSAHNVFLDKWVANGLVGLFLYLSILGYLFYLIWFNKNKLNIFQKSTLTSYLVAYLVFLFFGFEGFVTIFIFYFLSIFIYQNCNISETREFKISPKISFILSLIVFFISFYSFSFIVFRTLQTNKLITTAHKSQSLAKFVSSYNEASAKSIIGKYDVALQFASKNTSILINSNLTNEDKAFYLENMKNVVTTTLDQYPDNPLLLTQYGFALWSGGDIKGAIHIFKKIENLSPQKQENLILIGNLLLKDNNPNDAFNYFKKAYELDTTYHRPLFYLSYCTAIQKNIELSDSYLKKLSAKDVKENMDLVYTVFSINNRYDEYFDYILSSSNDAFRIETYAYWAERGRQQQNIKAVHTAIASYIHHYNLYYDDSNDNKVLKDIINQIMNNHSNHSVEEMLKQFEQDKVLYIKDK